VWSPGKKARSCKLKSVSPVYRRGEKKSWLLTGWHVFSQVTYFFWGCGRSYNLCWYFELLTSITKGAGFFYLWKTSSKSYEFLVEWGMVVFAYLWSQHSGGRRRRVTQVVNLRPTWAIVGKKPDPGREGGRRREERRGQGRTLGHQWQLYRHFLKDYLRTLLFKEFTSRVPKS
jgi:hypothetical protein